MYYNATASLWPGAIGDRFHNELPSSSADSHAESRYNHYGQSPSLSSLYSNPTSSTFGFNSSNPIVSSHSNPSQNPNAFHSFLNQYQSWASNLVALETPCFPPLAPRSIQRRSWSPHGPPKSTQSAPLHSPSLPTSTTGVTTSSTVAKSRRTRTTFSQAQLKFLEAAFERTQYPDAATRGNMSTVAGLPESRIQIWFKNRRAKYRKSIKVKDLQMVSKVEIPSSTVPYSASEFDTSRSLSTPVLEECDPQKPESSHFLMTDFPSGSDDFSGLVFKQNDSQLHSSESEKFSEA